MSKQDQQTHKDSMRKDEILTETLRKQTPWNAGRYMTRNVATKDAPDAKKTES